MITTPAAEPGVVQHRVDTEQPQRHRGDEQRGEPGRHGLLADADRALGDEQQHAHDRAAQPLGAGRPVTPGLTLLPRIPRRTHRRPAASHGQREHDQAGHQGPGRSQ
jgi:hypothetical protein